MTCPLLQQLVNKLTRTAVHFWSEIIKRSDFHVVIRKPRPSILVNSFFFLTIPGANHIVAVCDRHLVPEFLVSTLGFKRSIKRCKLLHSLLYTDFLIIDVSNWQFHLDFKFVSAVHLLVYCNIC